MLIYSSEKYRLLVVLNFTGCTVKMFLNASFNFSTTNTVYDFNESLENNQFHIGIGGSEG